MRNSGIVILDVIYLMAGSYSKRLKAGSLPGIISLITFWLSFEFISLHVNNITPWLNLGNGLSKRYYVHSMV